MPTLKSALKPRNWLKLAERLLFNRLTLNYIASAMSRSLPGNSAYPVFSRHGFHLLRKHYYLPLPDADDLTETAPSELIGLQIDADRAFELVETVFNRYKSEFNAFPAEKTDDPSQFHLVNGTFMAIDGNAYYAFIRHHKPRRIVEIGSGNSTVLAAAAIRKNKEEGAAATELICIEPYPPDKLKQLPEVTQLKVEKVQHISLSFFEELKAGDILFIDSTHTVRPGGDVWWEYCEILPRLVSGVLVHVHDVSLPHPYPKIYFDYHWYWMEQYMLQTFLAFNSRFEIIWPGNYLMTKFPEKMRAAFLPEYDLMRSRYPLSGPSSFWMRVKEQ